MFADQRPARRRLDLTPEQRCRRADVTMRRKEESIVEEMGEDKSS